MKAAQAANMLTILAGTDKPALAIVDSFWKRGRPVRFQAKYTHHRDTISITKSMLADLVNGDEMAFILGHELGHRALHRNWFRNAFHGQEVEQEADAYAVKLMRGRGYKPSRVLWWFDRRIHAHTGAARHKMAARSNAVRALVEGV